jgi:hypothetical protein
MNKILRYTMIGVVALTTFSCSDIDNVNKNPNSPGDVPSNMVMEGAEKWAMDNIYDLWFSGRQCLTYSQQWVQRNYTEEDRYQIRETVNNSYFNYLYMGLANFDKVITLNTDEKYKATNSAYGTNANQIAAAKIMKVWLMDIITDTWGNVPYSQAGKLESEGTLYAAYDSQKDIYTEMIKELTDAVNTIDVSQPAFSSGDVIFGGKAEKWKRFGNSLKCRLAIHLSKVDPNWKTYIREAVASGVMQSNDDAAKFTYSASGSDYCQFYEGFYVEGRNDFSIARPLLYLLKGEADELNHKTHPWQGTVDPRLCIYTCPNGDGEYTGMPFVTPTGIQDKFRTSSPDWKSGQPLALTPTYSVPLMTYAELKFILCEYNGYDKQDYEDGVRASLAYWYGLAGKTLSAADEDAYVAAVSKKVDAESCAIQKYLDLFTNGTEAWTEIRRTGYPEQLMRPGEIACIYKDQPVKFTPLSDTKGDIIERVKYPTNESTLNGTNFKEAVAKLSDGTNNYYTKMYWDVRKSSYDHPANK